MSFLVLLKLLFCGPQASFSRSGRIHTWRTTGPICLNRTEALLHQPLAELGVSPHHSIFTPTPQPLQCCPRPAGGARALGFTVASGTRDPRAVPLPRAFFHSQACPLAQALQAGLHRKRSAEVGTHSGDQPPLPGG